MLLISVCDFVIRNISKQYFLSDEINENIYNNKRFWIIYNCRTAHDKIKIE